MEWRWPFEKCSYLLSHMKVDSPEVTEVFKLNPWNCQAITVTSSCDPRATVPGLPFRHDKVCIQECKTSIDQACEMMLRQRLGNFQSPDMSNQHSWLFANAYFEWRCRWCLWVNACMNATVYRISGWRAYYTHAHEVRQTSGSDPDSRAVFVFSTIKQTHRLLSLPWTNDQSSWWEVSKPCTLISSTLPGSPCEVSLKGSHDVACNCMHILPGPSVLKHHY